MKRLGHLFGTMTTFASLRHAALRAARGKRAKPGVAAFLADLESEVLLLQHELTAEAWRPQPYRTFSVADPKPRTISAAAFRDRVVHHALCGVLEPVFERLASFDSYACRAGKGSHAAVARAQHFGRRFQYFLKLDVRRFFESIDHAALKTQVRRVVKDARVLALVDTILDHGAPGSPRGKGLPIGNLTSQHFANFQLSFLDHVIKEDPQIAGHVRYMDDLVLFADDRSTLWAAHDHLRACVEGRLALALKSEATVLAPVAEGLPFLGFRIWPRLIRLDAGSARRFRRNLQIVHENLLGGWIDEESAARSAASLVGHVAHADTLGFRRSFFARLAGQARTAAP